MTDIVIHIGAPRTGTTTLQKHVFPLLKSTLCLQKEAYQSSGDIEKIHRNQPVECDIREQVRTPAGRNTILRDVFILSSVKLAVDSSRHQFREVIQKATGELVALGHRTILISSERLSDGSLSLEGDSLPAPGMDITFGIHSLSAALRQAGFTPLISVCLRDPIPYLKSKYIRTAMQRHSRGRKSLRPRDFIEKQLFLEQNHPGTSALTPALHAEFIRQLQDNAFVKAFGFQQLLDSEDVFALMGLQGEERIAFRRFPRENRLVSDPNIEKTIEAEIRDTLKQSGFDQRLARAQMFL